MKYIYENLLTYLLTYLLLDLWNTYSVIFWDIFLQHILLYLGIMKKHFWIFRL